MKRASKIPKQSPDAVILAYVVHPITVSLMTVLDCASDEDLISYGKVSGEALTVLVNWAKKMPFGFASTDDLRRWFYNEHIPKRIQDLLTRIGKLLG